MSCYAKATNVKFEYDYFADEDVIFSKKSQYAIKSLVTLASRGAYPGKNSPLLVTDLAEYSGVPAPFLGKIISELSIAGIVTTKKGRGGGVMLTSEPKKILLRECLEAVDRINGQRSCILEPKPCSETNSCPLHEFSKKVRHQLLEKTTLDKVLGNGKWLKTSN